jgi:hypothetical protein
MFTSETVTDSHRQLDDSQLSNEDGKTLMKINREINVEVGKLRY